MKEAEEQEEKGTSIKKATVEEEEKRTVVRKAPGTDEKEPFFKRVLVRIRGAKRLLKSLQALAQGIQRVLIFALVLGATVLVWLGSILLARNAYAVLPLASLKNAGALDLATILFGASSIALFMLSILIAFVAVFGWGAIKDTVKDEVKKATKKRFEELENEVRGRSFGVLGYVMGEMNIKEDLKSPSNEDGLKEALRYCEQSYRRLKGTGLSTEFMALNNLLSYACILKDKKRRGFLLAEAKKLKIAAQDNNSYNLLLTYARTILEFSTDKSDIQEAYVIYTDIVSSVTLDEKQKIEVGILDELYNTRAQQYSLS